MALDPYRRRNADPTRASGLEAAELTRRRNRANKEKRISDREVEDAVMTKLGAQPGMSQADQNAVIQRRKQDLGTAVDPRTPRLATQTAPRMPVAPTPIAAPQAPSGRAHFDPTQINEAAKTGRTVSTPFGTVSSRTPSPVETFTPAAEPNGVANNAVSEAQQRLDLQKRHPNIFVAGTPENAAFVAHASDPKLGLKSAYENADNIMASLSTPATEAPPTAKSVKADLAAKAGRMQANQAANFRPTANPPKVTPSDGTLTPQGAGTAFAAGLGQGVKNIARPAVSLASGLSSAGKFIASAAKAAAPSLFGENPQQIAPKNPVDFTSGGGRSFTQGGPAPNQPAAPKPLPDFTSASVDEADRRRKLARGF